MKPPIFLDAADILRLRTALAYDKAFEVKGSAKGPVPPPPPLPFDTSLIAACSPDDGLFYVWIPRVGDSGAITGQWQNAVPFAGAVIKSSARNPDDGLNYLWVPRIGDSGLPPPQGLSGEWVLTSTVPPLLIGRRNPDDGQYYAWIPRTGDSGAISGEWQSICAIS